MDQSVIVFCYRKIIDANSSSPWEKLVFDDSYLEFRMQFQNFNKERKCFTFAELIRQQADAERLHFLVSPSVSGYIQQLRGQIPDVVDVLGKQFLNFSRYRFELINSDIRHAQGHQVAINFYSSSMNWYHTIGNTLLLSEDSAESTDEDSAIQTYLYQLQPFVSIHTLKLNP
ncbi:hypothetical protein [Pedobacter cryoconitis]|uniref:Uncharacterized protein n=1 Tax=Pedobacter cryoconitis TaxID=188932 RepID=A0A7X0J0X3_9SPHI|nr:hypothetical protein [Pedobacter cryoconitis]MBB6499041.1 hypothetical protein [Pedobacter cryoconitis]